MVARRICFSIVSVFCTKEGETPIHLAAKKEDIDILEHLKSVGADINARNKVRIIICIAI